MSLDGSFAFENDTFMHWGNLSKMGIHNGEEQIIMIGKNVKESTVFDAQLCLMVPSKVDEIIAKVVKQR